MTEVNSVSARFEDDFVQANNFSLAERGYFRAFFRSAGIANHILDGDCGSRRRIFLVNVVAFKDLS